MAKRGRRPKSDAAKRITGNPGRRRLRVVGVPAGEQPTTGANPAPQTAVPDPPGFLAGEAREEWLRIVPELAKRGRAGPLDRATIVVYCRAWADYVRELAKIDEPRGGNVVVFRNDKGELKSTCVSPHVTAACKFADALRKFGADLGLNPAARGELGGATPKEDKPGSKLEAFLKLKRS